METLVKAAVIVLSGSQRRLGGSVDDARDALERDVATFLRSLRDFPEQPLPFAVAMYRDFFALVAQWRHEEPSVDARHTIDSTRQWIEHSSASQRFQFDQELIRHPEKWGGPFELTGRLLSLLRALHANSDNGTEQLDKVAHLLVESLERAAETVYPGSVQRLYILGLLGIFLDASAELGWQAMESKTYLFRLAVGLLVDLIWRDEESGKIAVGFLDRIAMRDGSFASKVAAMLPSAILVRLSREANDPYAAVDVQGAGRLMPIATIFEICLSMMISSSSFEDAARYIQSNLLDPLSTLLSKMLERTIEDPSDEHIAELDTVSTRLYDLCDKALQVGSM